MGNTKLASVLLTRWPWHGNCMAYILVAEDRGSRIIRLRLVKLLQAFSSIVLQHHLQIMRLGILQAVHKSFSNGLTHEPWCAGTACRAFNICQQASEQTV